MEREPAFAEAKPGERTEPDPARSAETMERTSSGTLLPEKSGVIRTRWKENKREDETSTMVTAGLPVYVGIHIGNLCQGKPAAEGICV